MKMMKMMAGLLGMFSLLFSLAASAGPAATVTLGGSQSLFDDDQEVDDELFPFGAVEFRFTDRWAAEFWMAAGETDGDNGFDVDTTRWHLDALYYLDGWDKLKPYLAFGGGQLKRDWDVPTGAGNLDKVDEEANAGIGAHYFFTENLSLRGDARYLYGFDDSTNDFTLSVGLSYRFGAPEKSMAAAPAPEPQRLDSDGDGVYDDMDECPNTPPNTEVDARGCERIAAPEVAQVASVKLMINFDFDKTVVKDQYMADIKGLADFLKRFDDMQVDIEGHTDSMGPDEYNEGLSQRRAQAVRDVLVNDYGIASSRIEAKGYGESRPVATNDTADGRAQNRRVMATLEVEYVD